MRCAHANSRAAIAGRLANNPRPDFSPHLSGRYSARGRRRPEATEGYAGYGYKTASGRLKWLNRDPIGERGGINLYRFAANDPINQIDPLGLEITYFYGDESEVFPDEGVPYLGGDTYPEQFAAAAYIVIPFVNNALSRIPAWAGQFASWATGDPNLGGGLQNVAAVGSIAFRRVPCMGGSPGKYTVEPYNQIRGTVPGMNAHHMGEKSVMPTFVPGYDPATAPAILVPSVGHTIRGPFGIVSRDPGRSIVRGLNRARHSRNTARVS